jgi:hypothetical protein
MVYSSPLGKKLLSIRENHRVFNDVLGVLPHIIIIEQQPFA